ncbi:hypothetical protein ACH41H_46330 [Streptomyces sp. NPDC020800]|uniref:hypothetical protein n=1 Tax=Streptomyces sp. NPDC020800 TaxID=3365092 RepID=UPI0037BB140A
MAPTAPGLIAARPAGVFARPGPYDPGNKVTLVIWTNPTLSPEGRTTAQALLPTVLNPVCAGLSLPTGQAEPGRSSSPGPGS